MKKESVFRKLLFIGCVVGILLFSAIGVEASQYRLGDINTDGSVNAADALLALQSAAQINTLEADQVVAADVNKDNAVSAEDALQILTVAARLDIFRIPVGLNVDGDAYTIDKIFDVGAYVWNYTLTPDTGLALTKEVKELPEDSNEGETPEQVYTITAQKEGSYQLYFRLCPVGNPEGEAIEEMVFDIHAKVPDTLTPFSISEAFYPRMAQYPFSSGSSEAYDAWHESLDAQKRDLGDTSSLQNFFKKSSTAFLTDTEGKNKVYSPLNVYMALSMLAQMTDGETRGQILQLLGSITIDDLRRQASDVWNVSYRDDGAQTCILANSLWLNDKISFKKSTMDTLAHAYYASSYRGEMGSDAFDEALQAWLNQQTGGLLKEQVANIEKMDPSTVLALANTIYFKAKWLEDFDKSKTSLQTFRSPGGDIRTDFMHQRSDTQYYWGDHFTAVAQDFSMDGEMWLILPEEGVSPEALLSDDEALAFISQPQKSNTWTKHVRAFVNKAIPKFDVASQFDLTEALQTLGVTDIFDETKSDFSPLTNDVKDPIVVSKADHAARVTIDEEGCTAAAFTVSYVQIESMPSKEYDFTLDRPFLFCITNDSGLPLFIGIVNTPTK